jgi:hypothetical protein
MRYADALAAFRQYLEAGGLTAEDLDAPSAVTAMLGFYATERASDVDMDPDADMILFQWGTFDWGSGPAFEYDITRQLCIEIDYDALINSDDDEEDDDEDDLGEGIWQLHLTVYFRPDEENARLGSGERWLERPDGIGEFARWIAGLPATAYCASRRPLRTALVWDQV